MTDLKMVHYIRIELPHDATQEEKDRVQKEVIELTEKLSDEFDYDIPVSGGAWYPPVEEEPTTPVEIALSNLRKLVWERKLNGIVDVAVLQGALRGLRHELGMEQTALLLWLERQRAINDVALRNQHVEDNLVEAISFVTRDIVVTSRTREFQAGTQ